MNNVINIVIHYVESVKGKLPEIKNCYLIS